MHAGHDMFAPTGTPLVAVTDAVVADAGSDGGQGNYVQLYDPQRKRTYVYMHMVAPTQLAPGERVEAGERVGGVGCTGSCWGEHLHFEIREGRDAFTSEPRDPLPLLRQWRTLERPR
jgi:murein DD-endopeptidase MepM/ murein hydrolase activator NlpD